ncbi:membrane-associated protein, putative [Bodo saltans]|uniref:Membrane-associated protein, putative n=1 Tax=Bodo saltans TaxID=75058 RepID=A0A0S4JNN7_BODSA|nr:membrane-associated protein, putative [Bodo saltans]|eukprot:CUG91004.1 membrane-associated protein, putative [Bodo saltans]
MSLLSVSRTALDAWRCLPSARRTALAASCATVTIALTAYVAVKCFSRSQSRRRGGESDEADLDFADHREANFSLFRRDVVERLENIQRRLDNAKCLVYGTPPKSSLPSHANHGVDHQTIALPAASVEGDASAVKSSATDKMDAGHSAGVAKTLVELDELLTKLMMDIDGAPVAGLEHLKAERKHILKLVLECTENVAELRQALAG